MRAFAGVEEGNDDAVWIRRIILMWLAKRAWRLFQPTCARRARALARKPKAGDLAVLSHRPVPGRFQDQSDERELCVADRSGHLPWLIPAAFLPGGVLPFGSVSGQVPFVAGTEAASAAAVVVFSTTGGAPEASEPPSNRQGSGPEWPRVGLERSCPVYTECEFFVPAAHSSNRAVRSSKGVLEARLAGFEPATRGLEVRCSVL